MKKLFVTLTLILSTSASALDCVTDAECVSATLSLIKKAIKLGACSAEVDNAAKTATDIMAPNDGSISALEKCVGNAKRAAKFDKQRAKRIERINKALGKS